MNLEVLTVASSRFPCAFPQIHLDRLLLAIFSNLRPEDAVSPTLSALPPGWNVLYHVLLTPRTNSSKPFSVTPRSFDPLLTDFLPSSLPQLIFGKLLYSPLENNVPTILQGLYKPFQKAAAAYFLTPSAVIPLSPSGLFILSYSLILKCIPHFIHAISSSEIRTLFSA